MTNRNKIQKFLGGLMLAVLALPAAASQNFTVGADLLAGKPFKSADGIAGRSTNDFGGQLRAEWDAKPFLSLGLGYSQTRLYYWHDSGRTQVGALDVTGRLITPQDWAGFRPFVVGGVGYNVFGVAAPGGGHYHGQAEAGVRYNFNPAVNADLGLAYNFVSPITASINMVDVRAGLNYTFGL
jgi:hypothetical protein